MFAYTSRSVISNLYFFRKQFYLFQLLLLRIARHDVLILLMESQRTPGPREIHTTLMSAPGLRAKTATIGKHYGARKIRCQKKCVRIALVDRYRQMLFEFVQKGIQKDT